MNCKIALLALIGLSSGTIACSRFQPQTQPSPVETGISDNPVTAVSEIALQACKTEIVRLVPQSQSFRVYDYQPQSDGTSLLLWRTSEKTAGFCKVDQDGKVLQLSTDEEGIATTPTAPPPTATAKPTTRQSTAARSAILTTKTPGSRVNIRSKPTTEASSAGYGLDDDLVQVIDETQGKDGFTWYFVKFESGTEGWIRGDLVELASVTTSNTSKPAAAAALSACKRRAAQEFQTNEAEVSIVNSQSNAGGGSTVSVRSSSGTTADCQTNPEGNVIAWVVRQQTGEDPATMCDPKKGTC